jgi:multiple sugar transport system substrate-binding protein
VPRRPEEGKKNVPIKEGKMSDNRPQDELEPTENLVDGLATGHMSRDEFIKRASLLGLSSTAIGGMLAVTGKATAGDLHEARRLAGSTVNLLVPAEGAQLGVKDKMAYMKKQFGINVNMTALPVGPLNEKLLASVKQSSGTYDLISVLGFTVAGFVGAGYFTDLTPYVKKLPASYGYPSDYPKGELDYLSNFNVKKQTFGGRTPYLIPGLYAGPIILYYRTDLFKKAGLAPPRTWKQYLTVAKKLNTNGIAGNTMVAKSGDVSMFLVDWYSRFAGMGGKLMSGSPQQKNFTPHLTSPVAVAALQHMVDCVKLSTPGVLSYDFTISTDAFSAGKTAMMCMWSTIAGPVFNPKTSKVANKVAVLTTPGNTPALQGNIVRGGWGMGIPKNAKNKDGAWTILTYLCSRDWGKFEVAAHQTDPARTSVFNDPALNRKFPYLRAAGQANARARILEIANIPETFELITDAAQQFAAALSGSSSAAAACKAANDQWITVLKRGGHLK